MVFVLVETSLSLEMPETYRMTSEVASLVATILEVEDSSSVADVTIGFDGSAREIDAEWLVRIEDGSALSNATSVKVTLVASKERAAEERAADHENLAPRHFV